MGGRNAEQVARRAVILGATAFRAHLEVTDHPRASEVSPRVLPWLNDVGCGDELYPIERELLSTPYGQLNDTQTIDANWAGEGAALYCWMLNLCGPLEETSRADQSRLPGLLCILKPEASEIIRTASLRDRAVIEEICCQFVLIQSVLRESRVGPPARDIVRSVTTKRLNEVGLAVTEDAVKRASDVAGRMTPQERRDMAGPYFVRSHRALWFFSDRRGG